MVVRLKDGESLLRPHRRHFYHILANEMGIDHWKISGGYGMMQLMIGLIVLSLRPLRLLPVFIFLSAFFYRLHLGQPCDQIKNPHLNLPLPISGHAGFG